MHKHWIDVMLLSCLMVRKVWIFNKKMCNIQCFSGIITDAGLPEIVRFYTLSISSKRFIVCLTVDFEISVFFITNYLVENCFTLM